jgi:xanthine dehydrogenase accessory factor
MLVFADGSQAGTLGGGCVEAEVKRRALGILTAGAAEIVPFLLDNDYGWDDGLICGGRMLVLVDPLRTLADAAYYRRLLEEILSATGCIEAVVYEAKDGLRPGASYLFDAQGVLVAQLRGEESSGDAPAAVRANLPPLADRPRPKAIDGVAYLPELPRCRLLIVGAGHVGQAVAHLATDLGFDVWVVDDREQYANRERFPKAEKVLVGAIDAVLPGLEITPSTYCLIVTRGHNHDEEALFHLVDRGARYVGMIGSKRKIKLIFDDLLAEGISAESLAQVYAPLGIDIGSQTVPEIAVSILAELIAHRNLGRVPGRPESVLAGSE